MKKFFIVIAGILPLLVDWIYKVLLHPRPFWAFYYDPETIYVHDGLRLLSGRAPLNVDNPGTPVQLLTALIEFIAGRAPQSIDALRNAGYVVALLLVIGTGVLLERTLFRETPPLLAVAGLWTFFIAPAALQYQTIWSPEILFFPFGGLVLAALAARKSPMVIGLCAGLCIATKFVFLAWVPALLIALAFERRRIRDVAAAAGGIVAGFLLATLPAAARYGDMARWLWRLATRTGPYGSGSTAVPAIDSAARAFFDFAMNAKGWILWCAVVAIVLLIARRRERSLIIFGVVAIASTIVMAMRTPNGRYLLPAALGVVVLSAAAKEIPHARAAFVMALLLMTKAVVDDCRSHDRLIAFHRALRDGIDRSVASIRKPGDIVVYGWRAPEPSFALRILATDEQWLEETKRLYPREGHFNDWMQQFHLPKGARRWEILVISRDVLPRVPVPVVSAAPDVGPFAIVRQK